MSKYDDIIHLEHHVSKTRPQMPLYDRAAQFSSFAALTGHSDAIGETARLTDEKIELDEYEKEKIDLKLRQIEEHIKMLPPVEVVYFVPDEKKAGGKYVTYKGNLRRIDKVEGTLLMEDKTVLYLQDILGLESPVTDSSTEA